MFSKEHPFLAFTCHFPLIYNTILQNEKKKLLDALRGGGARARRTRFRREPGGKTG